MPRKSPEKASNERELRTLNVSRKLHAKLKIKAAQREVGLTEFVEETLSEAISPRKS